MFQKFKEWIYELFGIEDEIQAEVEAKREEVIGAAEALMPDFAKIRDEKAKAGVAQFKEGREMVKAGSLKMLDGEEDVELAQILGSRIKIRSK